MTPTITSDTERWVEDVLAEGVPKISVESETLLDVYLSADQSITAGSITTVALDTVNKDELGEFDTGTHEFVPNETGWYIIEAQVVFGIGADQDNTLAQFQNVTDGVTRIQSRIRPSGVQNLGFPLLGIRKLLSGKHYDLRGVNYDSDDSFIGGEYQTFLTIRRAFR